MVVLSDVIVNMKRTVDGKEKLLAAYRSSYQQYEDADDQCDAWLRLALQIEFLEINLEELRRILKDLEEIQ